MTEYWDIYDKDRNLTGKIIRRGDTFEENEYYVCCEIWITNSERKLLMALRHPSKKAGNMWEFVGGGVLAGETTKQAAVREVKEEVGIDIKLEELELLDTYSFKNYFMDIFVVKADVDIESLVLQENEVIDAKWVTRSEVAKMIEEGVVVKSVAKRYGFYGDKLNI